MGKSVGVPLFHAPASSKAPPGNAIPRAAREAPVEQPVGVDGPVVGRRPRGRAREARALEPPTGDGTRRARVGDQTHQIDHVGERARGDGLV